MVNRGLPGPEETAAQVRGDSPSAARQSAARQGLTLSNLDPRDLIPDPDNIRSEVKHDEELFQLAVSIHHEGLLAPILCRRRAEDGRLVIVAGHRRRAAAILGNVRTVPVLIRRDMRPDAVLAAMLAENAHRKDLDPIEEARALVALSQMHGGLSHNQLAGRTGLSQPTVSRRIALLTLNTEDQEKVRTGQLTEGRAYARAERSRPGPAKGSAMGWHFTDNHPLAALAEDRCSRAEHSRSRKLGGVACGGCWEAVIRADAATDRKVR